MLLLRAQCYVQASQAAGVGSFKTVRVHYQNPSASVVSLVLHYVVDSLSL